MTRLRRNLKPYIAALRLSQTQLILFVEGSEFDPVFYGKIVQRFGHESSLSVELRRATELPNNALPGNGGSGGKIQLTNAAQLWERYKMRHLATWHIKKVLVFCIDKDADDVTGLPPFIPSLVRTPHHSVENHLFSNALLSDALESLLSLAPGELASIDLSNEAWKLRAASQWLGWVTFCVLCLRLEVRSLQNYSTPSLFNKPPHMAPDRILTEQHFSRLQAASSLDVVAFAQIKSTTEAFVLEMFNARQHDRIFKGKWYCDILFSQMCSTKWKAQMKRVGKGGLVIALRSKFALSPEDYGYYRDVLSGLIK